MLQIMGHEGENAWVSDLFYKDVAQTVLLYGSYTWLLMPHMILNFGDFHHRVASRMMGKQPLQQSEGGAVLPTPG